MQLAPDRGAAGYTSYEMRCGEDWLSCYALFIIGALLLIAFVVLAVVLAVRVCKTGKYLQGMGGGRQVDLLGALIYKIFPIACCPTRSTSTMSAR